MTVKLVVCSTCNYSEDQKFLDGQTGGEILAGYLKSLNTMTDLEISLQKCYLSCNSHCNLAIKSEGKPSFVVGRFTPSEESAQSILDYVKLYAQHESGEVPYRQWPEGMRGHFLVRLMPDDRLHQLKSE